MSRSQNFGPFWRLPFQFFFFSWPFAFVFPGLFYFRFFLRVSLHGVKYGQSLKMGTLINYRYKGPFYHHFCTKSDNVVFKLMSLISKNDCCADRSIKALLSAYQECLVIFKSMTSQVVQRAWSLSAHIWWLRRQRVNGSRFLMNLRSHKRFLLFSLNSLFLIIIYG